MYWYTNLKNIATKIASLITMGLVTLFVSCTNKNQQKAAQEKNSIYFDLPQFFKNEIVLLSKANPTVLKTVKDNNESENKEVKISNWNTELSSFLSIDLNTAAYQGYINKDSINNLVIYNISKPDLDLKTVRIQYNNGIPSKFEIEKTTENFLYKTDEKLTYIKDSLYNIQKVQKVIFLDSSAYQITGLIN